MRATLHLAAVTLTAVLSGGAQCAAIYSNNQPIAFLPNGASVQSALVGGERFDIAVYKPEGCSPRALIFVFSGKFRNALTYRDWTVPLAKQTCGIVFSPSFPLSRFPISQYQRGGFPVIDGRKPTARYVPLLETWAGIASGLPNLPVVLVGHSAGGQFLERVSAYVPGKDVLTVIMNPSTYVEATMADPVPYGFKNWPQPATMDDLKHYLHKRIAIILGAEDTIPDFPASLPPITRTEGRNRLERGQWAYVGAQNTARALDTPFGWSITLVPGIGHDAPEMLASRELRDAIEEALSPASSR